MNALLLLTAAALSTPAPGCPIELAVYRDLDKVAEINFRPADPSATVTNQFNLVFGKGLVLSGMVMWSQAPSRPVGMLRHNCPDGDVTAAELEACTVWQGVIYAGGEAKAGFLPRPGEPAPQSLILSDLAFNIMASDGLGDARPDPLPSDIFELSGCQE